MTLPTDIIFPFRPETFNADDPKKFQDYMQQLVDKLTDMYQQIAQNVNGWIKPWTPSLFGVSAANVTYANQFGWSRRSGIVTELWFDLTWTACSSGGDVGIQLPYKTAKSSGAPWVGVIQSSSSSNTFGGGYTYLVWNATPDTSEGLIVQCGSGISSTPIQLANKGGYKGYIQYLGQEFENQ
jgi:hypothetical protein